jgi:hypothetical protein
MNYCYIWHPDPQPLTIVSTHSRRAGASILWIMLSLATWAIGVQQTNIHVRRRIANEHTISPLSTVSPTTCRVTREASTDLTGVPDNGFPSLCSASLNISTLPFCFCVQMRHDRHFVPELNFTPIFLSTAHPLRWNGGSPNVSH